MARGQQATDQLNTTNAVAANAGNKAGAIQDTLTPAYTSMMEHPLTPEQQGLESEYGGLAQTGYLSPEQKASATTSEMGTATQPFQTAGFQAANRAAATGNASDLTAQQDQLAIEEGQAATGAAANLNKEQMSNELEGMQGQEGIAQQGVQNQMEAMYGLGGLGQQDTQAMESMYGLGPGTLNAQANLTNASWDPLNEGLKVLGLGAQGAGLGLMASGAGKG